MTRTSPKSRWLREFGAQLREARRAAGKSQADLAAEVGVHRQTAYLWEAGRQAPDAYLLARVANALGAAVGDLLPSAPT